MKIIDEELGKIPAGKAWGKVGGVPGEGWGPSSIPIRKPLGLRVKAMQLISKSPGLDKQITGFETQSDATDKQAAWT